MATSGAASSMRETVAGAEQRESLPGSAILTEM
jgi:hypothetical protein